MQPAGVIATMQVYIQEAIDYNKVVFVEGDGVDCWDDNLMELIIAEANLAGYNIDFVIIPINNINPVENTFVTLMGKQSDSSMRYDMVLFSGFYQGLVNTIKNNFDLPFYVRRLGIAVDGNLNKSFFFGYFA